MPETVVDSLKNEAYRHCHKKHDGNFEPTCGICIYIRAALSEAKRQAAA